MAIQFANYVMTTLLTDISSSSPIIAVGSTAGFPPAGSGDYFYLTIVSALDVQNNVVPPTYREIVKVTAISGLNLAVTRGQDNTTAQAFAAGAIVELRLNAQALYELGGGGGGAPTDATYVTLSTDATLTNERVLTAGSGITLTDAGAGSTLTVAASVSALTDIGPRQIAWAIPQAHASIAIELMRSSTGSANYAASVAAAQTFMGQQVRGTIATTTAQNSTAHLREGTSSKFLYRGNAARLGGFNWTTIFGFSSIVAATGKFFAGVNALNSGPSASFVPSNGVNCVYLAADSGSTTMSLMHNDAAGTCTVVALGADYPVSVGAVYELQLVCAGNDGNIDVRVHRLDTTVTDYTATLSTNIPVNTTYIGAQYWVQNDTAAVTATTMAIDWMGYWYTTPYNDN